MPNPYRYRAVISRLASLADAPNPVHVQVVAAGYPRQGTLPGKPTARAHPTNAPRRRPLRVRPTQTPRPLRPHRPRRPTEAAPRNQDSRPALDAGAGAPQDQESLEEDDDPL